MRVLLPGIIGISGLLAFLGIMLWWTRALPLIIIVLVVLSLLIYDWVQTMRFGESNPGR
jgi:hypothetical protein